MSHELLNPQNFSHEQLTEVLISGAGFAVTLLGWLGYLTFRDRKARRKEGSACRAPEAAKGKPI